MTMHIDSEKYYFDKAAADRVVTFIETFCTHTKGDLAGQPFLLGAPYCKAGSNTALHSTKAFLPNRIQSTGTIAAQSFSMNCMRKSVGGICGTFWALQCCHEASPSFWL